MAGIGSYRFDAYAEDVAVTCQELRGFFGPAGGVWAVVTEIDVLGRIGAPGPAGAEENPGARHDFSVGGFPFLDMSGGQEKIGIFLDVFGYVEDAGGADEFFRRDAIDGRGRQVLAGDPVDGSIEMGAGVLAGFEGVPIPEGAARVVAGGGAWRNSMGE